MNRELQQLQKDEWTHATFEPEASGREKRKLRQQVDLIYGNGLPRNDPENLFLEGTVEDIIDSKNTDGINLYLIKWQGINQCTWEPDQSIPPAKLKKFKLHMEEIAALWDDEPLIPKKKAKKQGATTAGKGKSASSRSRHKNLAPISVPKKARTTKKEVNPIVPLMPRKFHLNADGNLSSDKEDIDYSENTPMKKVTKVKKTTVLKKTGTLRRAQPSEKPMTKGTSAVIPKTKRRESKPNVPLQKKKIKRHYMGLDLIMHTRYEDDDTTDDGSNFEQQSQPQQKKKNRKTLKSVDPASKPTVKTEPANTKKEAASAKSKATPGETKATKSKQAKVKEPKKEPKDERKKDGRKKKEAKSCSICFTDISGLMVTCYCCEKSFHGACCDPVLDQSIPFYMCSGCDEGAE